MRTIKNKLLLKAVKQEKTSHIITPTEIEHYEVVAAWSESRRCEGRR